MIQCPECGADGRILHVEEARGEAKITYICPNRRCTCYAQPIGTQTINQEKTQEMQQE